MLTRRSWLAGTAGVPALSYAGLVLPAHAQTPRDLVVMARRIDDIVSLDPQHSFEYMGNEIGGNVYQRLVTTRNDAPARLVGDVAESWEASADARTFTFRLKADAKFASGAPVTAEDAAFSLQRAVILNKSPAFIINQFGFTKDNVRDLIKAADARTLVVRMENPTSPSFFYYCLSANVGSVVEKAQAMKNEKDGDLGNAWLSQNSAGSGAFMVRQWRASETVMLDVNPHFSGEKPKIRRMVVRHIADPSAQLLQLQRGDIDIARDLGPDQIKSLTGNAGFSITPAKKASLMYMALNQNVPALAKPEVRQAIKWAIDYDGIQKNIVSTTYDVHQAFLPANFPSALDDKPFSKNVARAKELLAAAGLAGGFEVSLDHSSGPPIADIAQAIQANLAEIGVKVTLVAAEMRQVITKTRARQHQMAIVRWGADYFDPHTNAEAFSVNDDNSDNARNRTLAWRSSWLIPELTKRVRANVLETDPEKRTAEYLELQRIHQQTSPFVIMLQEIEVAVARANVTGLDLGPMSDRTSYARIVKA
ncbi:MAG: ABC transporter substrate-binding protein [Acetobacteraceae bacterium]|nr:ABC transporter substrate-binding protein [Acetobacteraceae bacterium]